MENISSRCRKSHKKCRYKGNSKYEQAPTEEINLEDRYTYI